MLPALSGLMCSAGARAAEQSKSPGSSAWEQRGVMAAGCWLLGGGHKRHVRDDSRLAAPALAGKAGKGTPRSPSPALFSIVILHWHEKKMNWI